MRRAVVVAHSGTKGNTISATTEEKIRKTAKDIKLFYLNGDFIRVDFFSFIHFFILRRQSGSFGSGGNSTFPRFY